MGILAAEGVAFWLSVFSGPFGWISAIGIHAVVVLFNYIKDNSNKNNTLKKKYGRF